MNLKIYKEYGALNSVPVFDAFEKGVRACNFNIVDKDEDAAVIWSVLWQGKMAKNQMIYNQARASGKPIIIIEVGNLLRGKTWRISANNINSNGIFNTDNLDKGRPAQLNVKLEPLRTNRNSQILIALQHQQSLQWEGQPSIEDWANTTIQAIKEVSNRPIIVRPHPRCLIRKPIVGAQIEIPKKIPGTYDSFNIDYNYHCIVNYNSGPAVQAAIAGTPVICNSSSLAAELSGTILDIENITLPDRENWFLKLCHTEWTIEEIATGLPLRRLIEKIS